MTYRCYINHVYKKKTKHGNVERESVREVITEHTVDDYDEVERLERQYGADFLVAIPDPGKYATNRVRTQKRGCRR